MTIWSTVASRTPIERSGENIMLKKLKKNHFENKMLAKKYLDIVQTLEPTKTDTDRNIIIAQSGSK